MMCLFDIDINLIYIYMKYFLFLLLCFSIFINSAFADNNIDNLKRQLSIEDEINKIDVLLALSKAYWSVSPKKGLLYSDEAVIMAKKHNSKYKEAKALLYGGVNAYYLGDYEKSIKYYQKSLIIAKEIHNTRLLAYNLNNLGMVNSYLRNYRKAINNYSESSLIMKELGDEIEYAKIINNIGELNMILGNYDEALANHLSILKIIEESDEQNLLLCLLNDIGFIYSKKKNYEKALYYLFKSLKISNEIDDNVGKTKILNRIGIVLLKQKNYKKAKEYFYNGLEYAKKSDTKENLKESYKNLSDYYSEINNYKKSLDYYKLYKQISDSILNENKMNKIVEMQTRYESESKEKENNLLRKKNEVKELLIEKQTYFRNFLIVLFVLAILLIIFIYNRLTIKRKISRELEEKNNLITAQKNKLAETLVILQEKNNELILQKKEIQSTAEKLTTTNKKLQELNATKNKFFSIIAHDLKSPFNAMIGFSELLVNQFDEFNISTQKKYLSILSQSVQNVYKLLENLLTWSRSQMGNISFKLEEKNIHLLTNEAIKMLSQLAKDKTISLSNKLPTDLFIFVDNNMFSTIIRNLISNAIKFTPKGGIIEVNSQLVNNKNKEKYVEISVKDNGIGITPEVQSKLFNIKENHSTQGTEREKGTGLGLIICKEFVEKHGGKIWIESEKGKGSKFIFTLPMI